MRTIFLLPWLLFVTQCFFFHGCCSSSGLAVYLNIDPITKMLPSTARVRGLASAGYFLDYQSQTEGYADQMLTLAKEQVGRFY
jgi:hypothetical protein